MTRNIIAVIVAVAVFWAQTDALWAQRSRQSESSRSRGSVSASSRASASSRGSVSRSGNTWSGESRSGNVQGSGSRTKTDEGFQVDRTFTTDSGASKTVSKDVNVEDREVQRDATATNRWGESATRETTAKGEGGYRTVEGKTETSTGREISSDYAVGRTATGRPAVAGSVNTKYYGNYDVAAVRKPYGGYTKAVSGPYGGRVTTTLPAGYRTTVYHGRNYYHYGGVYYRPYAHRGVHYYYPVPAPY